MHDFSLILVLFSMFFYTFSKVEENQPILPNGETEKRFWDAMCNADRRDYERICNEFGVKDMEFVLKRLEEKKKERAQNKYKVCRNSSSQKLRSNVLFSK